VITNVASDHLGLNGIYTMEQLTRLKSLVVENVHKEGYAVLNADDPNLLSMQENLECKTALFSLDPENPVIKEHCAAGGIAAVYDDGNIVLLKGDWAIQVDKVINIPLTYSGKAAFQVHNVLAACLAGFVQKVEVEEIRISLQTFVPSPAQLPGRMNIFEFKTHKVLVDYAHNPHSMEAIGKFITSLGPDSSVAILAGTGDRRDEDLRDYGRVAAEYFDTVIIWQDEDYARGRDSAEVMDLIIEGARKRPEQAFVKVIRNEDDAVDYAIENAGDDSIICIFTGRIRFMTDKIRALKEQEMDLTITTDDIPGPSLQET
jgi:cyanophycin synthetase